MKNLFMRVVCISMLILLSSVATTAASENWHLNVLFPTPNYVVTTPNLYLHVNPIGYRFDIRYAGTPNLPTIGHYDQLIDGRLIDMSGKSTDLISMVGITPGFHILTLVPARNNNTELLESAIDIPFMYAGPFLPQPGPFSYENPPSISILSPLNGTTINGGSFEMTVDIQNFFLSEESYGKEIVAGVGHWQIYIDLPMMNCSCDPNDPMHMQHMMMMLTHLKTRSSSSDQQISLKGVSSNMNHNFTTILVDNQHMPLMPMVMDTITLYID